MTRTNSLSKIKRLGSMMSLYFGADIAAKFIIMTLKCFILILLTLFNHILYVKSSKNVKLLSNQTSVHDIEQENNLLTKHKKLFSYLNQTNEGDNFVQSSDYEDPYVSSTDLEPELIVPKRRFRFFTKTSDKYEADDIAFKSPEEIIRMRGFEVETNYVHTKDGYHLHLVRIVNPLVKPDKRPILFNHGLFESSTCWLMKSRYIRPSRYTQAPDRDQIPIIDDLDPRVAYTNLPFLLANTGYDVWLLSMRGTEFSQRHDRYDAKTNPKFWRYSLDHFALYDIPSTIDFILKQTKALSIGYVGHSQATYTIFALLSHKSKYNKLVKPIIAVAPVSHFRHMKSKGRLLMRGVFRFSSLDKHGPFPKDASFWRRTFLTLCNAKLINSLPGQFLNMFVSGSGQYWLNGYYSHLPFQTSLMVLRHFGQMLSSKRFARYSYGPEKNLEYYNSSVEPDHPMHKIKSKWIVLIGGSTDLLSTPNDMDEIEQALTVKPYKTILVDGMNHFDLITGDGAPSEVFRPILKILETAEQLQRSKRRLATRSHQS